MKTSPKNPCPRPHRWAIRFASVLVLMAGWNPVGTVAGEPTKPALKAEEDPAKTLQKKLKAIILPTVDFEGVTLKDAVEFLRVRSVELDDLEPDPALRGVNIIILPNPGLDDVRITMKLKAIPLGEALKFVAELAGCEARVDPNAVVISKKP